MRRIAKASDSQDAQCRSQKALDMSQLWKVFLGHNTSVSYREFIYFKHGRPLHNHFERPL